MKIGYLLLPGILCSLVSASACLAAEGEGRSSAPAAPAYTYATAGVLDGITFLGLKWKLLVDEASVGGKELQAAEVTFPANYTSPIHTHGIVEVIYVLSGTYDHEVNGKRYRLKTGMVGIVRPGDKVRHMTPKDSDAKVLILWGPAGDFARSLAKQKGTVPVPLGEAKSVDP